MTLFERVRASLSPDYEVREELGHGGMGVVFLADDLALERAVAIKVLLPGRATAHAVERFLREARAMAAVEHPRVLQVHRAGEAGGLFYYVMEYVPGETLAGRLVRGPLDALEVRQLADDLLEALEAIHDAGIVHRDVKPSNIFLVAGGAVLGDFGVALAADGREARLTDVGEVVGTPRYLAPEQRSGEATTATDLYAAALVLYEASTGQSWRDQAAADAPWAGVPRPLRAPLRRALQPDPARRWPDAASFRAALAPRRPLRRVVLGGLLLATALVLLEVCPPQPPPSPSGEPTGDLAILPFDVLAGVADSALGRDLAILTTVALDGLPDMKVIPAARTSRLGAGVEVDGHLRARFVARGPLRRRADKLEVRLLVESATGERLPERLVRSDTGDLAALADSVALALVWMVQGRLVSGYRSLEERSTSSLPALREFLNGEHAFHHNAWQSAERHYRAALAVDPGFALAEWRLWNVWRWQLTGEEAVDLSGLSREHGDDLGSVDRALLAAMARPPGTERIAALEEAAPQFGYAAYAWMLYGDELYHRGPLIGRPLEEAARRFEEAAARNPYLAPAYEHGVLTLTRLGQEKRARLFLRRLQETAQEPAPGQLMHFPTLLEHAILERFEPGRARGRRDTLFDTRSPERWPAVAFAARMGLALDVPEAQRDLGSRLVGAPGAPASLRANGHYAQGLALMVMGRPWAGLAHMDSAAALLSLPWADLEAAEWRVVPAALGIFEAPPDDAARAWGRLRRTAGSGTAEAARAAWALSLDAYAAGQAEQGRRWREGIPGQVAGSGEERLARLAEAWEALILGRPDDALTLSEPLLEDQFLPRTRDPFTRTVLHLLRARAYESTGDVEGAIRERVWSENQDIAHALGDPDLGARGVLPQAVEVDWVASPYSDRERARLTLDQGDTATACRLLARVAWLWPDPEPALLPARADDRRLAAEACP